MPKTFSVTVEGSLLWQVERMARGASRSEVVESALASWLRHRRRERPEEEIELLLPFARRRRGRGRRRLGGALRPIARRELEMNSGSLREIGVAV
jgi:hypothetical protein